MNVWETEDEAPPRNSSRHSRRTRKKSLSPVPNSSPGPMPDIHNRRQSKTFENDETISPLDPRRFTPTLHANLVAEILNLRRDQEEKMKAIEGLEESLYNSKNEAESLSMNLAENVKENLTLKRQLSALEGGTTTALGDLVKERDEAVDSTAEIKKRLETAQKRVKALQDESDRMHNQWAKDKEAWDDERRKLERKNHVAEGRLKTVLDEVAAYQASHAVESDFDDGRDGHASDTASLRSRRDSFANSPRFSMFPPGSKLNGMSLADELGSEEEEEVASLQDGRDSMMSGHARNYSQDSLLSRRHKHSQSIDSLRRPASVARGRLLANQAVLDKLEGRIPEVDETQVEKPVYVDTGVQFSPPPSPALKATVAGPGLQVQVKQITITPITEEANQRRKRVRASSPSSPVSPLSLSIPVSVSTAPVPPVLVQPAIMVSTSCQTMTEPPSPPSTSKSPIVEPIVEPLVVWEGASSATQTEEEWPKMLPLPQQIPFISIHPPTSRPQTPRESLLPQHFKDAACQVSLQLSATMTSVSVQTEGIRVDKRLNSLPKHLQPSSITSCPPSPETFNVSSPTSPPRVMPPPRNPRRIKSNQSLAEIPSSPPTHPPPPPPIGDSNDSETRDSYPGNNDNGPLSHEKSISRPPRTSSLFAGFDNVDSDETEEFVDPDYSDSDYRTALSAPRHRRSVGKIGRRVAPSSVPEAMEPVEEGQTDEAKSQENGGNTSDGAVLQRSPSIDDPKTPAAAVRQFDKPLTLVWPPARQGAMRRAALVSSGIAAHSGRSRSPSLGDVKEPPFPIPTRASSRKPPYASASAPSDGNRSPTRDMWSGRGSRQHGRMNSIRKSRSAANLSEPHYRRRRRTSRSPSSVAPSTEAPQSPQLPPMPTNEITSPYMSHSRAQHSYRKHSKYPSNTTAYTNHTNQTNNTQQSATSAVQATSVVDAIAQTMVGEWMFKYVRRRKSFGVSDSVVVDDTTNGVRHKRWVWVAPYERAVMWSSKQPTTGSALMGKSGRKLVIQSVLDVKDDNPAPKGAGNLFNRSILILTPARALKFTATTMERHYVWLTALTFLAHSSQAVPEVVSPHPPPNELEIPTFNASRPTGGARLQKHSIRDSIRVAKGREQPNRAGAATPSTHRGGDYSIRSGVSGTTNGDHSVKEYTGYNGGHDDLGFIAEAASPPVVPRYADRTGANGHNLGHGRKRSNTGSRVPPPLSFRGFSERGTVPTLGAFVGTGSSIGGSSYNGHAPTVSTAAMSVGTNGSSDIYSQTNSQNSALGGNSISFTNPYSNFGSSNRTSIRTSATSSRPAEVVDNFFEAVGTVRMEAFISPMAFAPTHEFSSPEYQRVPSLNRGARNGRRNSRQSSRERRRRERNRDSFYGRYKAPHIDYDDLYGGSKTAGEEDYRSVNARAGTDDPFRGF